MGQYISVMVAARVAWEAVMGFARTSGTWLSLLWTWRCEAGGTLGLHLFGERSLKPTDSMERTKWARSTVLGVRGWLTFQGQAGIPWENQAENVIIRKDLGNGSMLLCYLPAV